MAQEPSPNRTRWGCAPLVLPNHRCMDVRPLPVSAAWWQYGEGSSSRFRNCCSETHGKPPRTLKVHMPPCCPSPTPRAPRLDCMRVAILNSTRAQYSDSSLHITHLAFPRSGLKIPALFFWPRLAMPRLAHDLILNKTCEVVNPKP